MAKQIRVLPARRQRDRSRVEQSVLVRSAETLGRVIGTLHRQIDGARNRFTAQDALDGQDAVDDVAPAKNGTVPRRRKTVRASAGPRVRVDEPRKAKRAAKTARPKSASGGRASTRKASAKKAARHR